MPIGFTTNEPDNFYVRKNSGGQPIKKEQTTPQKDYYWDPNPEYYGKQKTENRRTVKPKTKL